MMAGDQTPRRRAIDVLMEPSVGQHLAIVGLMLLVVGAMALSILPETAAVWLIVVVVVIAHTGLFMVAGSVILRRVARRR